MVPQKIIVVPGIQHRLEKHADDLDVSHIAEPPVGSIDTSTDNPEFSVRNLLCQQVIFGVQHPFVKSAQPIEDGLVEQHEHSSAEGPYDLRSILCEVVGQIQKM